MIGLAGVSRVLRPGDRLLIVEFKRPSGLLSCLAMRILLHGRLARDFQDLPPMLVAAGFTDVRSGATCFPFLGLWPGHGPA